MAKQKTTEDKRELAKKVAQNVQLSKVRLLSSRCVSNVDSDRRLPGHGAQHIETNIVLDPQSTLTVIIQFGISLGYEQGHAYNDEPDSPILIKAGFVLTYSLKGEGFSREDAEAFASATALYNAWPYWREFVQSMTTRMGFPGLTVPLLHLQSIVKDVEHEDAASPKESTKKKKKKATKKPKKSARRRGAK